MFRISSVWRIRQLRKTCLTLNNYMLTLTSRLMFHYYRRNVNNASKRKERSVMSYTWNLPTKVLFGAGKVKELCNEKMPGKKALLLISSGKSVRENGALPAVETL